MNTKTKMHDRISAFADGELCDTEIEAVLRDLATPEGRAAWEAYHHVGDVLRSDELDVPLSAGFAARMSARLDAEPTILAPAAAVEVARRQGGAVRKLAAPAFAAAAVAALAFVVTPPVLRLLNGEPADAVVATASETISHASMMPAAAAQQPEISTVKLEASDLNQYMQAHQRLSPSFDGSVQYDSVTSPSTN